MAIVFVFYRAPPAPAFRFGTAVLQLSQPPARHGTLTEVSSTRHRLKQGLLLPSLLLLAAGSAPAQDSPSLPAAPEPSPGVLVAMLAGNVRLEEASGVALPLSIDDAIARGLARNVQIASAQQNERGVRGEVLSVENSLLPSLSVSAYSRAQEINLAAMGFKPSSLGPLLEQFGGSAANFKTIVKVNTTDAQVNLTQTLFNLPAFFLYRAAGKAVEAANFGTLNVRGGVALAVGEQYLKTLADAAQIRNATSLEQADQVALRQAHDAHAAGTATNLDELRARVQLQTQQQAVISAQNTFDKDKVQLNRLMELPAGQQLTLTDAVPYKELAEIPLPLAMELAYDHRKDLLNLQAQLEVANQTSRAVRYQRLPTLGVNGYYGILGETTGLYHGVFIAEGSVRFPIFREAEFRGEEEVAATQILGIKQQIASLKLSIEGQIRSSMLDVQTADALVRVAESNVTLSRQELSDAEQSFAAGVTDNLPVVQAQATVANAESRLVQVTFQYNTAKLELARNTGVIESQYRVYLGR